MKLFFPSIHQHNDLEQGSDVVCVVFVYEREAKAKEDERGRRRSAAAVIVKRERKHGKGVQWS